MRVLIITKNFDLGGTEKHVQELCNALSRDGHSVDLISRSGRQLDFLDANITRHVWKLSDFRYPLLLKKITSLIREKDIQIIHGHQRMGISLAAIAGRMTSTPTIATVHGQVKYDLRSSFVKSSLQRVIMVAQNRLETVSDSKLRAKSIIIHNGISMEPAPTRVLPEELSACYVSRIDRQHFKALEILIESVWPKLNGIKLKIIGDGPYLEKVNQLIQQRNLQEHIQALGFQSNVLSIMKECSFVMGVGRVAIEALSQKIPVLPLNGHFCGEFISAENYSRLKELNFVARDDQAPASGTLIEKIKAFQDSPQTFENHSESLFPQIYRDFSFTSALSKITENYQELIAKNES